MKRGILCIVRKTSERLWKETLWRILIVSDKAHRNTFSWSNSLCKDKTDFKAQLSDNFTLLKANDSAHGFLTTWKWVTIHLSNLHASKNAYLSKFHACFGVCRIRFLVCRYMTYGSDTYSKKYWPEKVMLSCYSNRKRMQDPSYLYFRTSVPPWWPSMLIAVYITIILNINIQQ